ncbi:MAG: hypothetical protein ACI849_001780 [Patiriisocius sp.]|jgi:hypothetical protein
MFKGINKLLASVGNVKAMERLSDRSGTEEIMQPLDGDKVAQSKDGQLFIAFQEMQEYLFMETLLICNRNMKTFKGASLLFKSANGDFTLTSDTQEIECEFSNASNRFISEVTFDITKEQIRRVDARDFQSLEFRFKKKVIVMEMVLKRV